MRELCGINFVTAPDSKKTENLVLLKPYFFENSMKNYELSDREKAILRYVIHQFILTASPVGSRNISKKYNIGLSPATIRNIMSDLEDSGFLGHPHTSAGRVPTDKGYRFYVDSLMATPRLGEAERKFIDKQIHGKIRDDQEQVLRDSSKILSEITNLLACVTYPKFEDAVLQKLQLVRISSSRLLVVLSIKSGMVKTITLEVQSKMTDNLEEVQRLLNERLSGLKFKEIRVTFKDRMKNAGSEEFKPIIRVFLDSVDKIFADISKSEKSIITGAKNIVKQPEFEDHDTFQSIIELIEDRDVVVHIMDKKLTKDGKDLTVAIGKENEEEKLSDYSLVAKEYSMGEIKGTIGIIGPKRMEYSKAIAAVVYIAQELSNELKGIRN